MSVVDHYILQLERQYPVYLKDVISGKPFNPIILRGGKNKPGSTINLHNAVIDFQRLEKKNGSKGWEVQWDEWTSKRLGKQLWPSLIQVVTEDDLLFLLKRENEIPKFKEQLFELLQWQPQLKHWLEVRPRVVLQYVQDWPGIKAVVDYLLHHNVSGMYLRSLPVPVHTKFIEANKKIIHSLLQFLNPDKFPPEDDNFERGLALNTKPFLFRLRWLDKEKATELTSGLEIFAAPPHYLQQQNWNLKKVIMVENETNLYLLPSLPNTLAIFSSGKALHLLKEINFLHNVQLFYWGDLDEDGFEMLHSIRTYYPNVISLFMDENTIKQHETELDIKTIRYKKREFNLLPDEQDAYEFLLIKNQWLEQERLRQSFVQEQLNNLLK